jgi:hypothetical protein
MSGGAAGKNISQRSDANVWIAMSEYPGTADWLAEERLGMTSAYTSKLLIGRAIAPANKCHIDDWLKHRPGIANK